MTQPETDWTDTPPELLGKRYGYRSKEFQEWLFDAYCREQAKEWDEYVEDTPEVDRQHGT